MDNTVLKNQKSKIKNQKLEIKAGQVTLESCLVLVVTILLLLGINAIWLWANNNIAERQPAYNATRVQAGSANPGVWSIPSSKTLTEEWVFSRK